MSPASHTLLFWEPGHFHAALLLKSANARLAPDVHLYAAAGPERDAFVTLVESFNTRTEQPTAWRVRLHEAPDSGAALDALIAERRDGVAVLAGRNGGKLAAIARLHAAGFPVFADKPWITRAESLPDLERACTGRPLAADIMPDRHELLARLRRRVAGTPDLFGEFAVDDAGGPAIELRSVHHLCKIVNGRPLRRPAWYYDVGEQGDGMVDVQSHLTDQAQWLIDTAASAVADGSAFGRESSETRAPSPVSDEIIPALPANDFDLTAARRWATPVPVDLFRDSTGLDAYPGSLAPWVRAGVLHYPCNGEIRYRLRGVAVRQVAEWGQREPAGGGDLHGAAIRGTRATLLVRHGPETGYVPEVHLHPRPGVALDAPLREALDAWQDEFPGLAAEPSDPGWRFVAPPALHTGHESHFAMALEDFLDRLEAGGSPAALQARVRERYALIAAARALALDESPSGGTR